VIIAVLFNIIGMMLAAMGYIIPVFAITVMIFSIFAILQNTLRIRGIKLERQDPLKSAPLAEVEFSVPNMVCEGCGEKISFSIESTAGGKGSEAKGISKARICKV
jgi:Cu+-exporting ATPase